MKTALHPVQCVNHVLSLLKQYPTAVALVGVTKGPHAALICDHEYPGGDGGAGEMVRR